MLANYTTSQYILYFNQATLIISSLLDYDVLAAMAATVAAMLKALSIIQLNYSYAFVRGVNGKWRMGVFKSQW